MADLFLQEGADTDDQMRARPLAERLRPQNLDDIAGQDHLIGNGAPLRQMIEGQHLPSLILWGPPGCGKTTLARILAQHTQMHFVQLSAIFSGVKDLRALFDAAKIRFQNGQKTLLFIDEIHRFNKSQQDAFLPVVEDGTITLVGATTENPSFELNAALLSRAQVFVLKRLEDQALEDLLARAEADLGTKLPLDEAARETLKAMADGDGRYLLSMAEQIHAQAGEEALNSEALLTLIQRRAPLYDKGDEAHFNGLSAFHKSLRGSDADGALYWMARMLEGGEDPLNLIRRMTCVASEDIGNADPHALPLALSTWQAYERLGWSEGRLAMAQLCTYLATAPKSNASYMAFNKAQTLAKQTGSLMPPKHAMNAPTTLMKQQGYSDGYKYDHDSPEGFSGQNYFPEGTPRQDFYKPVERGFEREIRKRLDYWAKRREG